MAQQLGVQTFTIGSALTSNGSQKPETPRDLIPSSGFRGHLHKHTQNKSFKKLERDQIQSGGSDLQGCRSDVQGQSPVIRSDRPLVSPAEECRANGK